jgi:hypothetical protein
VKWRTTFGVISVEEQLLRLGRRGPELRPFCSQAGVRPGAYSRRLQRALADFGAEVSFAGAVRRLREHYGIQTPASAARRWTLHHGKAIRAVAELAEAPPSVVGAIAEMDGSMVPIVQTNAGSGDARKNKTLCWREARLCLVRAEGSASPIYGATLGSVEVAGWLWKDTARLAGVSQTTHVHGLGDGAPWILAKFLNNFGEQGAYLIDFFHVSEYLAGAALKAAPPGKQTQWRRRQQARLLANQVPAVLRALEKNLEPPGAEETPVRAAYQYLQERRHHLDYAGALAKKLPMGSGEIESGHRHVVQSRLKIAGGWWTERNMETMLGLRAARANAWWERYWTTARN